jgi:hypothetical protein
MKKLIIIVFLLFFTLSLYSCGGGGYSVGEHRTSDYKWYVAGNHPGKNVAFDTYDACMHIAKQLYEKPKCVFEYDRYKKEKEERKNQQTNTTKPKDTYWLVQTMPYKKLGTYNSLQSCVRAQTYLRIENRKIKTFCSLRP